MADETAGNQIRPMMMFWHASAAKNTAHVFAMTSEVERNRRVTETLGASAGSAADAGGRRAAEPPGNHSDETVLRNLVLISCDCDNVFDCDFVDDALRTLMASRNFSASPVLADPPLCAACFARGGQTCLSGRLVYWASDFLRIGGYDEEEGVVGAGYQEVDLCQRLHQATGSRASGRGNALTKSLGLGVLNKVGATTLQDRGPVKVENCCPSDLAQMQTWFAFHDRNQSLMTTKTAAGKLVRNMASPLGGGAPHVGAPLRLLLRAVAASTGAFWAATQAGPVPATRVGFELLFPAGGRRLTTTRASPQQQPSAASQRTSDVEL